MVKKYDNWGNAYHEPPYTRAEQDEFYRRTGGVVSFTRPSSAQKPEQPESPPPQPEEPRRA